MTQLPISLLAPVKLSTDTPPGLFLPHRPAGEWMLALSWENQSYAMYLTGRPFHYFQVKTGVSARGALVTDVEFIVDIESRYDAVQQTDPLGALVISDDELFVIGMLLGEGFADPVEVPLWFRKGGGTAGERIGFSRWSIAARDGERRIPLWSHEQ